MKDNIKSELQIYIKKNKQTTLTHPEQDFCSLLEKEGFLLFLKPKYCTFYLGLMLFLGSPKHHPLSLR